MKTVDVGQERQDNQYSEGKGVRWNPRSRRGCRTLTRHILQEYKIPSSAAGSFASDCMRSVVCERIGEMLNVEYSPPLRGGAAASSKSCEATASGADGREARARQREAVIVVSSAKSSGLNSFAELTTPAAPLAERIHFIHG